MICTGCSCLCNDVVVRGNRILNACIKGYRHIVGVKENRSEAKVDKRAASIDEAIEKAIEILKNARNPVIFGLDTTTLEAQSLAIRLAEKLECYIDDNSSFCLGEIVEAIIKKEVPSATLDDVRNEAYVVIYWGVNPYHSLPRHMSKFTYYPRGEKRPRGYEEDRYLVVVDVRKSETAMLAKKNAKFLKVERDDDLIDSFLLAIDGKAGKFGSEVGTILKEMKKSDFNVLFAGLGLKYGVSNMSRFFEMIREINEKVAPLYLLPAGFHANMRGFNETLFEKTGFVNKYSFKEKRSDKEFEFMELLKKECVDAALIVGTDPLKSLPFEVAKKIMKIKQIVVDPKASLTSKFADVVIPSAISGVECGGKMVRSDGVRFDLEPLEEREINDVLIFKKMLEGV